MAVVRKFTFDNDFDRPKPAPKPAEPAVAEELPPPPPPPPSFSEEELAAAVAEARKAALAEGIAKGRAEATAQTERQTATALSAIANHLAGTEREAKAIADGLSETSLQLSLAMVRRLFPELARRHGLGEIEGLLGRSLDRLRTEPHFLVKVANDQVEAVRDMVNQALAAHGYEGRIAVDGDEAMKPGDCRIEWSQGGLIRKGSEIWAAIETAIEQALAGIEPAPSQLG
ncbi:MAG TPA: FliH/SctL family protein [Candidatus Cybelea sp.]|nr:FliH/SctL family protein [Candidatus Cybelea sp.]